MAKLLQALLLISGFCAPVLAAFAMESESGTSSAAQPVHSELFKENSATDGHSWMPKPNQNSIDLTGNTNPPSAPRGSKGAPGIKKYN